ncbi:hypothetical protein [Streptomyces sp. NPDC056255]|uniref:hypothetical protein n=1 Tax=Streptomyces sp. NPDC056255 TaxID=3345764 RepID=UPI0035DDFCC4
MILSVIPNPSPDRTYELPRLNHGSVVGAIALTSGAGMEAAGEEPATLLARGLDATPPL